MPTRKILMIATTRGSDLERTKNLFKSIRKRQAPFTFYILKSKNDEYPLAQREIRDPCERMFTAPAFRETHVNENLIFFTLGIRKNEEHSPLVLVRGWQTLYSAGGSISQSGLFGTRFGRIYENVSCVCLTTQSFY